MSKEWDTCSSPTLEDIDRAIELFNKALPSIPSMLWPMPGWADAYASKYALTKDPRWMRKPHAMQDALWN